MDVVGGYEWLQGGSEPPQSFCGAQVTDAIAGWRRMEETKSELKRQTYVLILARFCAVSPRPFSFLFFIQMESTIICLGLR